MNLGTGATATDFYTFALERDRAKATLIRMNAPRAATCFALVALLAQGSALARGGHPGHGGWRPQTGASVVVRAPAYVHPPHVHPIAPRPRVFVSAPLIAAPLVAAPIYYHPPVVYPPPVYAPPSVTYYSSPPQQYIEQSPPPAATTSRDWRRCGTTRSSPSPWPAP